MQRTLQPTHRNTYKPSRKCAVHEHQTQHSKHLSKKIIVNKIQLCVSAAKREPEKMLATAAIIKLNTTPGPAIFLATMPATRYIPVPQHDPTPKDVRSKVVKHF